MNESSKEQIPLLVNSAAGSVQTLLQTLRADSRLRVIELDANGFPEAITRLLEQGVKRVLVCGGDGTLALAASCLAGQHTEMGIIAGGTLNHFATRLNIPLDATAAIELAINGHAQPVDAGFVNERLFLNTSSLGVYVTFVRQREFLERRLGYFMASLLAGLRRLLRWRQVKFDLGGNHLQSPLVFIGLNERELRFPQLGQPKSDGDRGLHLIAVTTDSAWQTLLLSFNVAVRGLDPMARARQLHHWIVPEIALSMGRKRQLTIALDGELLRLDTPLQYRFASDALQVVMENKDEINSQGSRELDSTWSAT